MDTIDIIIPVYNEETSIQAFMVEIIPVLVPIKASFRLIFIDDGSDDNSLDTIKKYEQVNADNVEVAYISFVRNFGKEAAMLAGLQYSKGDFVMFMDVDLQDPPTLIPQLYTIIIKSGSELVGTRRLQKTSKLSFGDHCADLFYSIMDAPRGLRDYCIFTSKVRERLLTVTESQRFTRFLLRQVAKETEEPIPFQYVSRKLGEAKWSFSSLVNYAWTGILCTNQQFLLLTHNVLLFFAFVANIICNFIPILKPLGVISSIFYVCYTLVTLLYYVDAIYTNTKHRPAYFIKEVGGFDEE